MVTEKEKGKGDSEFCEDGKPRLKLLSQREDVSGSGSKSGGVASSNGVAREQEEAQRHDWEPKEGRTAPRQDYAKGLQLRDQPFGVEVRNVKCFKCGRLGHVNTDKIVREMEMEGGKELKGGLRREKVVA